MPTTVVGLRVRGEDNCLIGTVLARSVSVMMVEIKARYIRVSEDLLQYLPAEKQSRR